VDHAGEAKKAFSLVSGLRSPPTALIVPRLRYP